MGLILTIQDTLLRRAQGETYFEWLEKAVQERYPRWRGSINWQVQGQVYAQINASRWIVICPMPSCNEAVLTAPGLPFFCPNCLNATNGGLCYEVVFPDEIDIIESVLSVRPLPATRNWQPGETVETLAGENAQHGLPGGIH